MTSLTTSFKKIVHQIDDVDVEAYAQTRNYLHGNVSRLSPYISRGVISLPFVLNRILQRESVQNAHAFIYELCWREYFQRIWWTKGDLLFSDLKTPQYPVRTYELPTAIHEATTGIHVIDQAIQQLYHSGYIHNHVRMYIASLVTNMANVHWNKPSKWMYYHLLDGDLASNTLSWQWVAGTFSNKKYIFNQENVNKYSRTTQSNTFLDKSYEAIAVMACPPVLEATLPQALTMKLPEPPLPELDTTRPLLLYTSYNLDPQWRMDEDANRVLVLEPSHFNQFPVSERVMNFIINLASEIPGMQVFCGEIADLPNLDQFSTIISKEHPTSQHFPGKKDEIQWMFPAVQHPKGSFTGFWKACERELYEQYS